MARDIASWLSGSFCSKPGLESASSAVYSNPGGASFKKQSYLAVKVLQVLMSSF